MSADAARADDPAPAGDAVAEWSGSGDQWRLRIAGDWQGRAQPLPPTPPGLSGHLDVDAVALRRWDARLASSLWQRLSALDRRQVEFDLGGLPPGMQEILALSLPAPPDDQDAAAPRARRRFLRRPGWVTQLGQRASAAWATALVTLGFVGDVILAVGRLLRGRTAMRMADLAWQFEQCGPRSLPIVVLVSFLVSLIVAYMGAAQLELFGAQTYIADLVTVGVVREIAALVFGIVLSGRIGAAFAAQIGSMRANEEVDALRTLGIDPIEYLVLPRVLALMLAAPLLTACAALVGMAVGWGVAVLIFDVAPVEYLLKSVDAMTMPHMLIGLLKGTVYGTLIGLAGCRQGLAAGKSAQAVGDATTAAVVQSIVWMAVAASALTVVFQRLDI